MSDEPFLSHITKVLICMTTDKSKLPFHPGVPALYLLFLYS